MLLLFQVQLQYHQDQILRMDRSASRRAAARRALLGGGAPAKPIADTAAIVAAKATEKAFADYCEATVELGAHAKSVVDAWHRDLTAIDDAAMRHSQMVLLLDRLLRGCRVEITEQRLAGCEALVLVGEHRAVDGKLPLRVTLPDGTTQEVSLRPTHFRLIQGRRDAEAEEAEVAAEAAAEAAAVAADLAANKFRGSRRMLRAELVKELKTKSFDEMRRMAAAMDAQQLLRNPLLKYDRATFREELAELLLDADDGCGLPPLPPPDHSFALGLPEPSPSPTRLLTRLRDPPPPLCRTPSDEDEQSLLHSLLASASAAEVEVRHHTYNAYMHACT